MARKVGFCVFVLFSAMSAFSITHSAALLVRYFYPEKGLELPLRRCREPVFLKDEGKRINIDVLKTIIRDDLKDKSESEKAVRYLNQQISKTALSEINEVLAKLLQEEIKKLTLIEANEYYVFDFIDPPAVMEKKIEPSRALICILFSLMGGILSILLVFYRHYKNN